MIQMLLVTGFAVVSGVVSILTLGGLLATGIKIRKQREAEQGPRGVEG